MKTLKQEELQEILENHKKWLDGNGGLRANLSFADLRFANLNSADLSSADLSSAVGNSQQITTIQTKTYEIIYTDIVMCIGCERHKIKCWFEFDDKRIVGMDGRKALFFWRKWKPILKQIMEIK